MEDLFSTRLEKLRDWSDSFLDFEGGEPELDGIVNFDPQGFLFPIGQTGNGSIFALWSPEKTHDPKDGPVVYLDSEGSPQCMVARSLDEFLAILPCSTPWLYEAMSGRAPPASQALEEVAEAMEEQLARKAPGKTFSAWWQDLFGVAPAPDPMSILRAAMAQEPTFERWSEQQG
ncbi:MAG: SMI1/KNR4 family protein [Polyangiaceae bacterium]|jgi:hypothetical protein|nr:SMI1/KNR4 family protein [Polyangiaceae bacterium]